MEKIIWFDTETTGVNPVKNDIIQIAGIIEINGVIDHEFEFKCAPVNPENINDKALEINHRTVEEIKGWGDPIEVYKNLRSLFSKYVNQFNSYSKFTPAGHNVKYDLEMLNGFFRKCGDKYGIGSYFTWHGLDTLPISIFLSHLNIIEKAENFKLATLCNKYGIVNKKEHDAIGDIYATRELFYYMQDAIYASRDNK